MADGAVFPNGIVSFVNHRNSIDDIDAGDINKIQTEVRAIEEALGSQILELNLLTQEEQNLESNLALFEAQTSLLFSDLSQLIQYVMNGSHIPSFRLEMNTPFTLGKGIQLAPAGWIAFTNTALANTGFGSAWGSMATGNYGWVVPKSGFYSIQGSVHFEVSTTLVSDGEYNAAILINGQQSHAFNRDYYNRTQTPGITHVLVDVNLQTWLNYGDTLGLYASQYSPNSQTVNFASLAGHWVRGL